MKDFNAYTDIEFRTTIDKLSKEIFEKSKYINSKELEYKETCRYAIFELVEMKIEEYTNFKIKNYDSDTDEICFYSELEKDKFVNETLDYLHRVGFRVIDVDKWFGEDYPEALNENGGIKEEFQEDYFEYRKSLIVDGCSEVNESSCYIVEFM